MRESKFMLAQVCIWAALCRAVVLKGWGLGLVRLFIFCGQRIGKAILIRM